jgi:uncharacterized protein (TIGR02466 family)
MNELVPFSTSIWVDKIVSDIYSDIIAVKESASTSRLVSNMGGWQSPSYQMDSYEFMKPIITKISKRLTDIYQQYGIINCPVLLNYWFNINKQHDYNILHRHPRSKFSVVYYVNAPDCCGKLVFKRPDLLGDYIEADIANERNSQYYYIKPVEHKLVIFPAYLEHQVEQNQSTQDRVSIAFNFD